MKLPPLGRAVVEVGHQGYGWVAGALSPAWCGALIGEVRTLAFVSVPRQVGGVRQEAEDLAVRVGDVRLPAMAVLADALVREVMSADAGVGGLGGYRPDEVTYQRYRGPASGISPHRDFKHHRLLVAIFTLAGRARFRIVADRAGAEVLASWDAQAGDLCLLRGPGFGGNLDGRPLHSVGPPLDTERVSLAFRMTGRQSACWHDSPGSQRAATRSPPSDA